ncbi:MAG: exosome complex exonuclease Rrp41 [Candidatus Thermoplasmatota archaeon]|nr:exosome complex exonuclease Rrp41 [Candidatus Thermoplasmatota archaeon]
MGGKSDIKMIDENGIRIDGRKYDEIRPITIEAGVLKRADGSAYLEWGDNKVLAAVYGPREVMPKHRQKTDRAIVQYYYSMAPFSVSDRKRPGPDRRSTEISKISAEALENAIFLDQFPRATIDVFVTVLQASAGTRCAALTAASVAVADAGVPMRDMVASCAAGKVEGHVVLDLVKEEDNFGDSDVPLAILPKTGEVVLMQMDGHMTYDEMEKAIDMATNACHKISAIQKEALKRRYTTEEVE